MKKIILLISCIIYYQSSYSMIIMIDGQPTPFKQQVMQQLPNALHNTFPNLKKRHNKLQIIRSSAKELNADSDERTIFAWHQNIFVDAILGKIVLLDYHFLPHYQKSLETTLGCIAHQQVRLFGIRSPLLSIENNERHNNKYAEKLDDFDDTTITPEICIGRIMQHLKSDEKILNA